MQILNRFSLIQLDVQMNVTVNETFCIHQVYAYNSFYKFMKFAHIIRFSSFATPLNQSQSERIPDQHDFFPRWNSERTYTHKIL